MARPFKIPESVLVVIHTPDREVLLIERADRPGAWQSVTGSRDAVDEPFEQTALREVAEETGIVVGSPAVPLSALRDWQLRNVYEIFPVWASRYAPGVTHNTEHVYGLTVPRDTPIRLAPREHLAWRWLPWREAADACFSFSNAEAILQLPRFLLDPPMSRTFAASTQFSTDTLRVATYNIHKGVRGVGPRKRLEIHNLGLGIEALDADLVFLQEVRSFHHGEARRFERTWFGWPKGGQADFLAPEGYDVAYRTNATTRDGEHGNALLSRWPIGNIGHHDVSDHRFEQRGLLHVPVLWNGQTVHAVVAHLGLMHGSRVRQVDRIAAFIDAEVPKNELLVVAGDFNDWGNKLDGPMRACGMKRAAVDGEVAARMNTFPSRIPVFSLDRIYVRGLRCLSTSVPRGNTWARMSDHLPLVAELALD